MLALDGHLQHYSWGSATALPQFLGRESDGRAWAEVWFGAHPLAPATAIEGPTAPEGHTAPDGPTVPEGTAVPEGPTAPRGCRLDDVIAADPARMLGADVGRAFAGRLPYLLKVIAPERPLSLQVHPTREHAAESFAAENAAGLALSSPLRTYRDPNHKPEMLIALTRFTALCGFRTPRRAAVILDGLGTDLTDRLHHLLVDNPTAHGMRAAFRTLVSTSMRPSAQAVGEVVEACRARARAGTSPSPRIDRFVSLLAEHHPGDPGVVAALLLNPVSLQAGEAMYVPAGALHAYIHGMGLEVMAASDNVLRAGLTPKKVDADEVLQCVSVTAAPPLRVAPERQTPTSIAYYAPVDDFELAVTELPGTGKPAGSAEPGRSGGSGDDPVRIPGSGPRIVLGLEGEVTLSTDTGTHILAAGRAVFVPAAEGTLRAHGHGRFAQASVP
ncbi:mannose-6-phosphate isomerase, class I [Brachybacterium sp. P6-10-X1]|uniref:mannose-6-phosphate isomerase, class I n=1 Tax=Brachybacterium sp. P6-10-X1 TaxID=1903186 RepID=UPI000971AA21|nr:mannose-6-phosphate isomerase, class I [Brachybacterium sp. P6-10-X1]APX33744.1 mannose-6-phosphate isomerase, class I [Brachybacterium sp. P6-10-X1]